MKSKLGTMVALGAIMAAGSARAQEITLRLADSFPVGHYIVENQTKPFMAEVTRATNGRVKFEHYPAEQLGKAKDILSLTLSGVADIGYVAPSFVSEKLPLGVVAELPEAFKTACEGTNAYWKIAREGGALDKAEFAPAGVKALFVLVLAPYQLYVTKGEITGVATLAGKKIRTTGGAKEIALRKLGAVPVQIPTPEVREAAARGTIDGFLFPLSSLSPYDVHRQASAGTLGENFGSFVVTYMISRRKWATLPEDVRKTMEEVGDRITRAGCEATDRIENEDVPKVKAVGLKLMSLPEAEHAKITAAMQEVSADWASALDRRGKPGTAMLNAFREALKP